ncbi:MAG: DUF4040 domain-containing protein [Verrucomicrobiales bacterium]|nr:DUF4040 domain-containing protein [Verrucomicrobiales bacterium]
MIHDSIHPACLIGAAFLMGILAPLISRAVSGWVGAVVWGAFPAIAFGYFLAGIPAEPGSVWRDTLPWLSSFGMDWDVWLSPLGRILALMVTGLGLAIALYGGGYFKDRGERGRFFAFFFVFMGAMLGLAVTENLLVLFVFWELTSVASFLLIAHHHGLDESRLSARDALMVTGTGGLALLAGILLLGEAGGSFQIGELAEMSASIGAHPLYPAIFCCIFAGAMTKSAQVPSHFWLPGAMTAPAPVSAYLHSATMVKAGVFLLAILHPVLGGTAEWRFTLLVFGAATMTWGALVAMAQTDLKRLLAFTTLSTLGTLTMLLGLEQTLAAKAVAVLLLVHALYKGALFLVAGALEKATGTRDVRRLGGLMRTMPGLGAAAVLAAASMSGLPPFIGFIAKELVFALKWETPVVGWLLLACGVVAGAANIVVALKVGVTPFLGGGEDLARVEKLPGWRLWLGPSVLGAMSLLLGLFPDRLLGGLVSGAVSQFRAEEPTIKLALWHGINPPLLISVFTFMAGLGVYLARRRIRSTGRHLSERVGGWTAQQVFRAAFQRFLNFAGLLTTSARNGGLGGIVTIMLTVAAAGMVWALWRSGIEGLSKGVSPIRLDALVAVGVTAVAAWGATVARDRMMAILSLGCAGFGLAAIFAVFGAPDLAITQIVVETLTLAFFALAIYGLPAMMGRNAAACLPGMVGKNILAVGIGVLFCLLTLQAQRPDLVEPVGREIGRLSLPEGHGRNVVNVILVDFRALDTLGEVAVLAIAALGVSALLGSGRLRKEGPGQRPVRSAVLIASARYTAPAMVVFSFFLLLRGHNEPGGGFIGGLVFASAAMLGHLARFDGRPSLLRLKPAAAILCGLALSAVSGLPGLTMGSGYLKAVWGPELFVPLVGAVKIGTPLLFDIGVYLVVAGTVLMLFEAMVCAGSHRGRKEGLWT